MIADLKKLIRLIEKDEFLTKLIRYENLCDIQHQQDTYPIYSFSIGSTDPQSPVLFLVGGVHGLEKIGAQLAWSLLKTTIDRLLWDKSLQQLFSHIRMVVVPLLNPVGYHQHTRSNGNGVDLMRNSPVDAVQKTNFLLGGHRYSKKLPWFRGEKDILEKENQALTKCFEKEAAKSKCVVALDFHSGFGMKDRLWFPFSYTKEPFDHLPEMHSLTSLFEQTHPYHIYQIEPQSAGYLLNGDIWDHLYLQYREKNQDGVFLPLTLEMGSWSWVRKNPLQIFSRHGAFNPVKEHRVRRTYRRHHLLFDFLLKAIHSNEIWSDLDRTLKMKHEQLGHKRWYEL